MKDSILVQILSNLLLQQGTANSMVTNIRQDATQVDYVNGFLEFEFSPLAPESVNDEEFGHPIQNPDSTEKDILSVEIISSWVEEVKIKSLKNGDEVRFMLKDHDDVLSETNRKLLISMVSNGRSLNAKDPYVVTFDR